MNFQFSIFNFQNKDGYAAITATILTLTVAISVIGSFVFFSLKEVASTRAFSKSIEARYFSEAGIEDVVYRLITGKQVADSEILTVGNGFTTTIITTNGSDKIVRSEGQRDTSRQNLETKVYVGGSSSVGASFNYGAQIGSGGVVMSQNSRIEGSVYSNGRITGPSSSSNVRITGDAFAAGTSAIEHVIIEGNARANSFDDSIINKNATSSTDLCCVIYGNAYADRITGSVTGTNPAIHESRANIISGSILNSKCYYQTIDEDSVCMGTQFPGTPITPPPNLPYLDLPISSNLINQWKTEAAAGGTINGDYEITNNVSLGPTKITGDLEFDATNKTLTVTGIIYVQGNIEIKNGGSIKCAASYGSKSCVILSDGWIHSSNNGQFSGSGTPGRFLMLLSTASGGGDHGSAIDLHNNATGAIFYAGNGLIYLHNNVTVTNLVANQINLQNGAQVIYDTLLQNVSFDGGGGGGEKDIKYWKEVE